MSEQQGYQALAEAARVDARVDEDPALVWHDRHTLSSSFTRPYPLVIERGEGLWVTDVDGNEFLDFTAGIAVNNTGHAHPHVVAAIEQQARRFVHMSGTDFYYEPEIRL